LGRSVAVEVVRELRGYTTWDGFRFVDREVEAEWILEGVALKSPGYITILYGPRGCGKTELLRALSWASQRLGLEERGYKIVVAEYDSERGEVRVAGFKGLGEKVREVLARVLSTIGFEVKVERREGENPHVAIASSVAERVALAARRGTRYVVAIDEYRVGSVELLASLLDTLANRVAELNREASRRANAAISMLITTSDAIVAEARHIVGLKVEWALIWNLSRQAAGELVEQIELQRRLGEELKVTPEDAGELLWRLA